MAWSEAFAARMQGYEMAAWEDLPDLGLYMDQVVTYLERQFWPLFGDARRVITPSMVNNYVKSGLVARPTGKKYERAQIAQLIILCALKQVLSLDDLRRLMALAGEAGVEALYRDFRAQMMQAQGAFIGRLDTLSPLGCAVLGASYSLICQEILAAQAPEEGKKAR